MEAKWLDDFIILAEAQSFTRAAEESHCSQSALSRRIQSLERWVGAELVDRDAYPMILTPAGQRFLTVCKGLKGTIEAARQIGKNAYAQSLDQELTIAVAPDMSTEKVCEVLFPILKHFPSTRLDLTHATVSQQLSGLSDGTFDLGIHLQYSRLPHPPKDESVEYISVGRDYLKMYGSKREGIKYSSANEKNNQRLINYASNNYLAQVCALALKDLSPYQSMVCGCEVDHPEMLGTMVRQGWGIGMLLESSAQRDTLTGLIDELDPAASAELAVVLARDNTTKHAPGRSRSKKFVDKVWGIYKYNY
jgi:LysR family transcriptional regulator, hypochlorite-specific transcription factor HypT